ncbi:hypothetical protein [Alteromonas flava]|uniref:hypothetical protein n=1 Tax=Alteromonas flava TaxID=2048003 RepID=UPI000C288E51|nr:hypothetical protein [Alteromonas flava]
MDIKGYIDYFAEISHLPRNEQFTYLERARDKINQRWPIPYFFALAVLIRALVLGATYALTALVLHWPLWAIVITMIFALLFARLIENEITCHQVRQQLKKIVSTHLPPNP